MYFFFPVSVLFRIQWSIELSLILHLTFPTVSKCLKLMGHQQLALPRTFLGTECVCQQTVQEGSRHLSGAYSVLGASSVSFLRLSAVYSLGVAGLLCSSRKPPYAGPAVTSKGQPSAYM